MFFFNSLVPRNINQSDLYVIMGIYNIDDIELDESSRAKRTYVSVGLMITVNSL